MKMLLKRALFRLFDLLGQAMAKLGANVSFVVQLEPLPIPPCSHDCPCRIQAERYMLSLAHSSLRRPGQEAGRC